MKAARPSRPARPAPEAAILLAAPVKDAGVVAVAEPVPAGAVPVATGTVEFWKMALDGEPGTMGVADGTTTELETVATGTVSMGVLVETTSAGVEEAELAT